MKYILLLLYILTITQSSFGQTKNMKRCGLSGPGSTCTTIETNGDITINWSEVTDPNNIFIRYEVYVLGNQIPLTKITNKITTSYLIDKSLSNEQFYISVVSLCGTESTNYGDTVKSISFETTKIDEGIELIKWDINSKKTNDYISIEYKKPSTNWIFLDSTLISNKVFKDTVTNCTKDFLSYRLKLKNKNCYSYSKTLSDSLKDSYHPDIPLITSVSFDTLKHGITLNWNKNSAKDVKGYIIYLKNNNLSSTLDTILFQNNHIATTYQLLNATEQQVSEFRIAAYDFCPSIGKKNQTSAQSEPTSSMLLTNTYDICNRTISLSWNEYKTWDDIREYRIFEKSDNNKWKIIDSTNLTSYSKKLNEFKNYEFIVEAISKQGFKSFSTITKRYTNAPSIPKYNYTNSISVNQNEITIEHYVEHIGGVKAIKIERKNNDIYQEISTLNLNSNKMVFKENNLNTSRETYTYRIQLIDSCGLPSAYSNEITSMLLKLDSKIDSNGRNVISWLPYVGYNGGVKHYLIYRSINNSDEKELIATNNSNELTFEDNLTNVLQFDGNVCYTIIAEESSNIYNLNSKSSSNQVCFSYSPLIYIPNAFTPQGKNPIFKPVVTYIDIKNYTFSIIDRWGQIVYQTNEVENGWNGSSGNQELSNGLYMYVLQYQDGNNKEYSTRGVVNLIR